MNSFDQFMFYFTNEKFFVVGNVDDKAKSCLVFDRASNLITLEDPSVVPSNALSRLIFGIFGIIRTISGPHLLVISKRELIGTVQGELVYRIVETDIWSYISSNELPEKKRKEEEVYLSMIRTVLAFESFYYSSTYDLTHTVQRIQAASAHFHQQNKVLRADRRFVWNGFMLRDLLAMPQASRFVTLIVHGYIGIRTCQLNGNEFQLTLISRRSVFRAGVRLQMRGVDNKGRTANFVETEQIVEYGNLTTSLVQIRGSVPIFWKQKPNLMRLPKPVIEPDADHQTAFHKHCKSLTSRYGRLIFVSLVDTNGIEKLVGDSLKYFVSNVEKNIKLVNFDFHKECRNMQYDNLNKLLTELEEDLKEFRFFSCTLVHNEVRLEKTQTGVFRTSCMDCLDRTNVVQSLIAKQSLLLQLQSLKIVTEGSSLDLYREFIYLFKNVWADNGDAISKQYSGTCALKSDYVRTGKRTYLGVLNDGYLTFERYITNNFRDGFRQDAIDFCLGTVEISSNTPSLVQNEWETKHLIFLVVSMFYVFLFYCLFFATSASAKSLFGSVVGCAVSTFVMLYNGESLVDVPKLKSD